MAQKREQHRMSGTPEYRVWRDMRRRTRETYSGKEAPRYIERGIRTCVRWERSFLAFYSDMGPRPSANHSIDRIDNDAGYDCGKCSDCRHRGVRKTNCRWATHLEQMRNTGRNVYFEAGGKRMTLVEWARHLRVTLGMLRKRLQKGLPPDQVFAARRYATRPQRQFTEEEIRGIREASACGVAQSELAKRYRMSLTTVGDIIHRRPVPVVGS